MKTKLTFLGKYALTVLAIIITLSVALCSCKNETTEDKTETIDSETYVDYVTNPTFTTVYEVVDFANKCKEDAQVDSLLMNLPELTLVNVASVIIKQCGTVTKKQLYEEYNRNKNVYSNLPYETINTKDKKEMEVPRTRVEEDVSTVYNTRDTIIDGKKCTIQTKITYEQ